VFSPNRQKKVVIFGLPSEYPIAFALDVPTFVKMNYLSYFYVFIFFWGFLFGYAFATSPEEILSVDKNINYVKELLILTHSHMAQI